MSDFQFQMIEPPTPIISDYVELATLIALFIIGAPLNLAAYTQLQERPVCTRLDILKRHLNYSDLIVLFIYVPSRGAWLLTYDWRGGDFLCRLVKFLHTFAFQISSNIIVIIALDRLLTVISTSHHRPERAHKRTKIMLLGAWITAVLISAPQFFVWRVYNAFPKWDQCMQIWEILRAEAVIKNNTRINSNELMREENIYVILHMLMIFWIPALIVMLSYVVVSCWVYLNSAPSLLVNGRGSECGGRGGTSYNTGVETDTLVTRATGVQFAANPKIVINDDTVRPLNCETRASSATSADIPRTNSTSSKVIASAMRRSHSTFSAKVNRSRAIRVSFLLVAAYIICWLPYNALSLIQFVDSEIFSKHANKLYCLHGMMVFNSVVNPYLYGLFGKMCRTKRRNNG